MTFYDLCHLKQIFACYLRSFEKEVFAIDKLFLLVVFTLVEMSRKLNSLMENISQKRLIGKKSAEKTQNICYCRNGEIFEVWWVLIQVIRLEVFLSHFGTDTPYYQRDSWKEVIAIHKILLLALFRLVKRFRVQ